MGSLTEFLASAPIPRALPEVEEDSGGIGGFVGNLASDVSGMVQGLGSLIGSGLHDVAKGATEAATLGKADVLGGYQTDDIVKAIPKALGDDYRDRYGGGLGGILKGIYEHPGAFLGDVATVATLGGAAAAKTAGVLAKGAETSRALGAVRVANTAGDAAQAAALTEALSPGARFASKVLPGTVQSAAHNPQGFLGGSRSVLNPALTKSPFEFEAMARNPIRRLMENKVWTPLRTKPIESLSEEVSALSQRARSGMTTMAEDAELKRLQGVLEQAEKFNATRRYRQPVSTMKVWKKANQLVGQTSGRFIANRDKIAGAFAEIMQRLPEDQLNSYHVMAQLQTPAQKGRRLSFDEVAQFVSDPANLQTPKLQAVADGVREDIERIRRAESSIAPPPDRATFLARAPMADPDFAADPPTVDRLLQGLGVSKRGGKPGFRLRTENETLKEHGFKPLQNPLTGIIYRDGHGEAVGVLSWNPDVRTGQPDVLQVAVDPAYQGAGIGTRLYTEAQRLGHDVEAASGRGGYTPAGAALAHKRLVAEYEAKMRTVEKARRYIESVAGESLADELSGGPELEAGVINDARLLAHSTMGKHFIDSVEDPLDGYARAFDHAYQPLRQFFGARFDKKAGGFVDAEGFDSLSLDDQLQELGQKAPTYYPHIEPHLAKPSSFLMSWSRSGMRSGIPKGHKASKGALFEDYLTGLKEAYEQNPVEAYSRRSAEALRDMETHDFIERFVTALGRPITALEEVSASERVINPDAVKMLMRNRVTAKQAIADSIENGRSFDDAVADGIQDALGDMDADMATLLGQKGRLYAVPKVAAEQIEKFTKYRMSDWKVRIFWDGPINAWRTTALYYSPRFFLNNALGNTVFLKLQGGKLGSVVRQLHPKYRKLVKQVIGDIEGVEAGHYSKVAQRGTHLGSAADTKPGQIVSAMKESKPGRFFSRTNETLRRFNNSIEDAFRRESFMTAIEKEASKRGVKLAGTSFWRSGKRLEDIQELGAEPRLVEAALEDLNKAMNDYSALGPFERQIVRRFFMPFWPFYKHVAKTIITLPYEHPMKAAILGWIGKVEEEYRSGIGPVPEWLEGSVPIGPGMNPGETRFLNTRGANPFDMFANFPQSLAGTIAPPIQMMVERSTGRDMATGIPFSSPDTIVPYGSDQAYQVDPATGQVSPANVNPGIVESLLSNVPQYGLLRDVGQALTGGLDSVGKRYSTGQVMTDAAGNPTRPTSLAQSAARLFGASTTDTDLAKYQTRLNEESLAAYKAYITQRPYV